MADRRRSPLWHLVQHRGDLPGNENWLTHEEAAVLAGFRVPKRRQDWLLGRWTIKAALQRMPSLPPCAITDWRIEADDHGAPVILQHGKPTDIPVSLSHSHGRAMCLLADRPMRIGCDIEFIEQRSPVFEETWFTPGERDRLESSSPDERARLVTLVWSAKESALKLLRKGLNVDTRQVPVLWRHSGDASAWQPFTVGKGQTGIDFHGWWRERRGMVFTVAADEAVEPPVSLATAGKDRIGLWESH